MNKKDIVKILFLFAVLAGFLSFGRAYAINGGFSIDLEPEHPAPGAEAAARITSYSFDVDSSEITWQIDGKTVAQGAGEKRIRFTMPAAGKTVELSALAVTNEGEKMFSSRKVAGNDVDFLWEALTHVPLWYKGRALPVIQSSVRVAAIPHVYSGGKKIPPSNLTYEWYVNFEKDLGASGAGKDSFVFKINEYEDTTASLKVSSRDGKTVFEKGIVFNIDDNEPKIVFYEENLLEGTGYNAAFSEKVEMEKDEMIMKAEPFFFSRENLERLSYEWNMNGETIEQAGLKNILSFRRGEGSGVAAVGLKIKNIISELQSAAGSLEIDYGNE